MGISRIMILLCVAMLLVSSSSIGVTEAKTIKYGPIRKGDPNHRCKGNICEGVPANPYQRGCEKEEKCRGEGKKKGDDDKTKAKNIITVN